MKRGLIFIILGSIGCSLFKAEACQMEPPTPPPPSVWSPLSSGRSILVYPSWTAEVVDYIDHNKGSRGAFMPDIAIDVLGLPHFAYYFAYYLNNNLTQNVRYAHRENGNWIRETVTNYTDQRPHHPTLVIFSGSPFIAWNECPARYDYKNGSVWMQEIVDNDPTVHANVSFAIDNTGQPYVIYYSNPVGNEELKYAWRVGVDEWQEEMVIAGTPYKHFPCLALDNNDDPHISYVEQQSPEFGTLRYQNKVLGEWNDDNFPTNKNAATRGVFSVIDSKNYPHISYMLAPT